MTENELYRAMRRQWSGTGRPPIKAMQGRNTASEVTTMREKELSRAMRRQSSGIRRPPIKVMQGRSPPLEFATTTDKELSRAMKRQSSGTGRPPIKDMHRRCYNLGACYYEGERVEKNLKRAKRYFQLAAKQGHAPAHARLARLEATSGMPMTLRHIHKARAALADGSWSSHQKSVAQSLYEQGDLPSLLRCRNQGCSVSYTDDVSAQTVKKLKSCSRCRKVAYCSTECQMEDWKERHKHECGKRLKVGEAFLLKSLVSRPELNGCRVVVERGMDEATDRVGVLIVADMKAPNKPDGGGGEGGDERKDDGPTASTTAFVGLIISVKPKNLKKDK